MFLTVTAADPGAGALGGQFVDVGSAHSLDARLINDRDGLVST